MNFDFDTETISVNSTLILTIEGQALGLPVGTTALRPLGAVDGALRYNTTTHLIEGLYDGVWKSSADWSLVENRPTTLSGYGITDAVSNSLGTPGIIQDIFANRPAAGTVGRLFIDTTNNLMQRDTGTTWETIGTNVLLLNDLSDVILSTPTINQVLQYNGTNWVNATIPLGTVTSVAATAPAAGFTIIGSPITTSGTLTFALANDLLGVEGLTTNGIAVRTATDTWTTRTITAGTNIAVTNGNGVSGNPTIAFSGTLPVANGGTGVTSTPTNGQLLIGNGTGYTVATLTAGTGISVINGAGSITIAGNTGTVTSVAATAPVAGFTITGSPITTSGTLTFALANDLLGVEGLTTNGIAVRTATDTWTTRTLIGTAGNITVTNGDGVSGNPTFNLPNVGTAGTYLFTTTDAQGRTSSGVAAPSGTGLYAQTAASTIALRTITGTANQITVTNGDGVSGNPTLSIPSTLVAPGSIQATTWLYQSVTTGITAAGATQGTATALTTVYNVVSTVAAGTGVIIPTPVSPFGQKIVISNRGANALNVYPNTSASIANAATNAAISLPVNQEITLFSVSATQWWVQEPTLVAGTNVTITPDAGILTIASIGGPPGGVDTNVQYNNSGAFAGSSAFNFIAGTDPRVETRGTSLTTQLHVGATGTYSTSLTEGSNNATLFVENAGDVTSEGLRCWFRRSFVGADGWITYDYDQNTPNIRMTDEDDDQPYIQFNTIGSGSYSSPQFMNLFSTRGTYPAGATTGFAWRIAQNVTNTTGMGTTPVMELDSQFLRIPTGTTAQRPASPAVGMIRYNTTDGNVENYIPNVWAHNVGYIDKSVINTVVTGTGSTNLISYVVPGGTLSTNGLLRIKLSGTWVNGSGATRSVTVAVTYGGTTMYSDASTTIATGTTIGWSMDLVLNSNNSVTAQQLSGIIILGATGAASTGITGDLSTDETTGVAAIAGTAAVNSALGQTFTVAITISGTGTTWTKYFHTIEKI